MLKPSLHPSCHVAYPLPKVHPCSLHTLPLPAFHSTHPTQERNPRRSTPAQDSRLSGRYHPTDAYTTSCGSSASCQWLPVLRPHVSSDPTWPQIPHVLRPHVSSDSKCPQTPRVLRPHVSSDPSVLRPHVSSDPTCPQIPRVLRPHVSSHPMCSQTPCGPGHKAPC